ncbi:MAG: gamma-glutamyl-gamma-aminobutyrate hydrolase family protein [Clostridia bacterium]|nr:gamma-glutamyl-gamma-aminobutyrate hydrolase family protein [Clostridia bacterium]
MRKMRILLSRGSSAENYIRALEGVGAEGVAQYLPKVDTNYDGLILCGGADVDPKYYNEENNGSVGIDIARDEAEFALLKAYAEAGKPVLGICRGCQLINVFFGGSLYQHLPDAELHVSVKGCDSVHTVTAVEGSVLNTLYGKEFAVNSSHHQAVKALGEGLRATAFWNGEYIEAHEHTELPIYSVQFHPERMCFDKARNDTVNGAKIFEHFIAVCEKYSDK